MATSTSRKASTKGTKGMGGSDAAPMMVDLLAWYYLIREKLWIVALGLIISMSAAVGYLAVTPKIFQSRCTVQVEQESSKMVATIMELNPEDFKSLEALKTVEGALASRSLMLRVIRTNNLEKTSSEFQPKPGNPSMTDDELADIMEKKVDVGLRRGTRLIDIVVDDPEPKRAAILAKSFVDEYVRTQVEQKILSTQTANEALLKQAADLKDKLEKSEQRLQEYREQYQTNSLEEKQNITTEKLKELNKTLTTAKALRIKLESELPSLKQAQTAPVQDLLALESVSKLPEIQDILKLTTQKEADFGQIKKRYLELHPKFQQAKGELQDLSESLERSARKNATMLLSAYESSKQSEGKMEESLKEQEMLGVELSRIAIPYNVLLREVQADRALFDSVTTRVKEMAVSSGIEQSNIRITELPDVERWPAKPKKPYVLAVALAVGFAVPLAIVFLLQAFNTTIRSVDQGENLLGLPSLAAVPQAKGKAARNPLVITGDPSSREAESFRCLRTSLSLLGGTETAGKTVLFTSAVPAEGKSYCTSNYSAALAQQGLKTLLIDADLRRPGLGNYFPKFKDSIGVSELLTEKCSFDQACHATEVDKLFIMPAGLRGSNPAELLGSEKFVKLLKEAAEKYDRVVVDTAPVNAVSDTLLVVEHVDSVVMVVRARKTPSRILLRSLHLLELAGVAPVGFVLNRLPSQLARYYYYDEGNYSSAGVYGT